MAETAPGTTAATGTVSAAVSELPLAPVTRAFLPEAIDLSDRFPPLPRASGADDPPAAWAVTYLLRSYQRAATGDASREADASGTDGRMRACPSAPRHFRAAVEALQKLSPPTRPVRQPADVFCPIMRAGAETGAEAGTEAAAEAGGRAGGRAVANGPPEAAPAGPVDSLAPRPAGPTRGLVRASQREATQEAGFTPDSLERVRRLLATSDPVLLSLRSVEGALPGASPTSPAQKASGEEIALALGYDDRRQALRLLSFRAADIGGNRLYWLPYAQLLENGRDTVAFSGPVPAAGASASGGPPSSGPPSSGNPAGAATSSGAVPAVPSQPGEAPQAPALVAPAIATPANAASAVSAPALPSAPAPEPPAGEAPAEPSCASLAVEAGALTGFVPTSADLARVRAAAAARGLRADVVLRPWPICEALLTLGEMQGRPEAPVVALVGGDRPLRVGETFAVAVMPPRRPSYLYVIYLEDDGSVVNLAPRRGVLRRQTPANAPPLLFGDGKQGRPTFRVTPLRAGELEGRPRAPAERGHEAVIVIAAAAPIAELEAAEAEGSPFYRAAPLRQDAQAIYPDRLFLSMLRGITQRRVAEDAASREVSAAILPLQIEE